MFLNWLCWIYIILLPVLGILSIVSGVSNAYFKESIVTKITEASKNHIKLPDNILTEIDLNDIKHQRNLILFALIFAGIGFIIFLYPIAYNIFHDRYNILNQINNLFYYSLLTS